MTIVHITDCFAPRVGGIETQVQALALAQADAGHRVHVITTTAPGGAGADDTRVPVHRIAKWMPMNVPVHVWPMPRVRRVLATINPDLIHAHVGVVSPLAWGATRLVTESQVPTVVTVHSYWTTAAQRVFSWSEPLLRWSCRRITWSAVSGVVAARIREALPGIGTVHILPNGIDPDSWCVEPVAPRDREVRVVSAARFVRWKRYVPLLRAFAEARHRVAGVLPLTLTCVGDGYDRGRVERFARRHPRLHDVHFPGRQSRGALRDLYAASDIFMQASLREGCGIAALEARSAGLPVILRAGIGTTEFLEDGVDGLFPPTDEGLADAIVRLALDPALRHRIASHNRSTEPVVAWRHVLARVEALYAEAVRAGGATPQTAS